MAVHNKTLDLSTCCLCGEEIKSNTTTPDDELSMDHVPPKQFYPKELRIERNLNLWLTPTHKRCNRKYGKNEE